jgi:YidC/Oxa1 family membrane protein insertase
MGSLFHAIGAAFHVAIYIPLYNALIFLVDVLPGADVGLAVVILTIIVRIILFPLSRRAVQAQIATKKLVPEVEKLKEKFKNDKEGEAKAIFALYKEHDVHPFAGFGLLLIQFPILIGLYFVFTRTTWLQVDVSLLYHFIHAPAHIQVLFLGLIDITAKHNILLAVLAGSTQAIYTRLSMGPKGQQTATDRFPMKWLEVLIFRRAIYSPSL